jgi:hypothetical protein
MRSPRPEAHRSQLGHPDFSGQDGAKQLPKTWSGFVRGLEPGAFPPGERVLLKGSPVKYVAEGWEGNPLKTYRWGALALALIPGLAVAALIWAYRRSMHLKPIDLSKVPKNAIIYGYHVDLFPTCLHLGYLRQYPGRGYLLGSHTFLSYVMNVGFWLEAGGMRIHRYDPRDRGGKAREWTLGNLIEHRKLRMGIFTDSGGPYERVRASTAELSKKSGRPCVALRIRASRSVRVNHHVIPLPGATLEVQVSEPIPAEEATQSRLQKEISSLGRKVLPKAGRRVAQRRAVHRGSDRRVNAGRRVELSKV